MSLRLDWCSYEAAKYAVEHWHYSKRVPAGLNVYAGAWEDDKFIGAVIFGRGSGGNIGDPYGLTQMECAELVRIALAKHQAPVSKIATIAVGMLRKQSPGLRLLVSFADPKQGHIGGIYQAMNWIFTGVSKPDVEYQVNGVWMHHRSATSKGSVRGLPSRPVLPKYRYLMPLDSAMRAQIEPLRKPYPKRGQGETDNAPCTNTESGGASPTCPLLNEVTA